VQVYRVGGAVRDALLGVATGDTDWVVVGATAESMTSLGFRPVGKDFPVFLHPQTGAQYALARTERKSGRGYKGFTVHAAPEVTLEEDLRRRDLTINAMAMDEEGRLIDPYGGERDLRAGILRHVSSAFVEDPLRVLRVARFAARFDFTVAPETLELMRAIAAAGELAELSAERIWQELDRSLATPRPRRFIEVLRETGALAAILPEADRLFGVPQRPEFHPEVDAGAHLLLALDAAAALSDEAGVRFAVLTHDLGKGTTPSAQWPRHHGHEARSAALAEDLCDRMRAPNEYRELARVTALQHGNCHRALELRPSTLLEVIEGADGLRRPERFERFLLACTADARGRLGRERDDYRQGQLLRRARAAAAAVDAAPFIARGLAGPELGRHLREARIAAIARVRDADRDPGS
jgi:tRNA nucleotidyltransferase (CCA-adding enzyme)